MIKIFFILLSSLVLAGCSFPKDESLPQTIQTNPSITPETKVSEFIPVDPIEVFLLQLTKDVKLPFDNPSKADIFWNEGDSSSTLKTYYGDSFLIKETGSTLEKEKIVSEYLMSKGFTAMKYNGSVGQDSRSMGYRKDNLICKTDFSIYPDETTHHLVVYCSDANKGNLRK